MSGAEARVRSQGEKGDCCGKGQAGAGREGQDTKEEHRKGGFCLEVPLNFALPIILISFCGLTVLYYTSLCRCRAVRWLGDGFFALAGSGARCTLVYLVTAASRMSFSRCRLNQAAPNPLVDRKTENGRPGSLRRKSCVERKK